MENAHAKSPDEVLAFFESNEEFGLSEQQVATNLHKYGFNGAHLLLRLRHSTRSLVASRRLYCSLLCAFVCAELPAEESALRPAPPRHYQYGILTLAAAHASS